MNDARDWATGATDDAPTPAELHWGLLVGEYVDGELSGDGQAGLFRHLAECADCRSTLESVLAFRRLSRSEPMNVPASCDAALMARLDVLKRRDEQRADSGSLWDRTMHVGIGRAAAAVIGVFLLGAGLARPANEIPMAPDISVGQESVEFQPPGTFWRVEPVYVFYPGVTVEAEKQVE